MHFAIAAPPGCQNRRFYRRSRLACGRPLQPAVTSARQLADYAPSHVCPTAAICQDWQMTDSGAEDPGTVTILLRSSGKIAGTEIIEMKDGKLYTAVSSEDGTVTMIPTDNIAA